MKMKNILSLVGISLMGTALAQAAPTVVCPPLQNFSIKASLIGIRTVLFNSISYNSREWGGTLTVDSTITTDKELRGLVEQAIKQVSIASNLALPYKDEFFLCSDGYLTPNGPNYVNLPEHVTDVTITTPPPSSPKAAAEARKAGR